ncbi:serine/threonine-protein kinase 16-like [Sycon ciliatum]|uniref:serine/threonine-protein kinase 16-like n=1 Tax=Sycon ciliatum TaxID=27933 RepID=UPI0020A8A8D3|eukprot:scpid71222/ scgid17647/ Serine/threonine-protein kinase 16; Myristoylated and palmitoylated serine/threonine-protein kinase; Protein kinase PKL12; TGF-beta-stimulated factor 1; Tyrosine-protein kinase STK16; hPSK
MGAIISYFFGQRLKVAGNDYQVVKRIGEGGFSFVFLVRHGGKKYALKRMLIQIDEQEEAAHNEIEAHGLVDHPNVMPLVAHSIAERGCTSRREALLVFPFFPNGSVQDLIEKSQKSGVPLAEERIYKMFRSTCLGVRAFHDHSPPYAHRDIKPHNLLLQANRADTVLMDLGSVAQGRVDVRTRQQALTLQETCAQTCTASYRAPELFDVPSECKIDERTDVWSLGCVLFAMAFGDSPFDGSTLSALSGKVTFPSSHPYSQDFCDLITWMATVDHTKRPTVEQILSRIPAQSGSTVLTMQV